MAPTTTTQNPMSGPGQVEAWMDACEEQLVHPGRVADYLRRSGWAPVAAARVEQTYRRRYNEHYLGYSALLVATGVAALAAGTAGHALIAGLSRPVNRNSLAWWLTVLVCSLPFSIAGHWWASRLDREDPVAVWSAPRHTLGLTLLWASGIVGSARLALYAGQLVGRLVGAAWARHVSLLGGFLNVLVVVGIALPLGLWAFSFLHRFDDEDPTVPPPLRHRPER